MLDVFSRFILLRPMKTKSSSEVASILLHIFSDTGLLKRLQSDQRSEFKGAVQQLMEVMQVQIIHSRPYYSQSQGKVTVAVIGDDAIIIFCMQNIIIDPCIIFQCNIHYDRWKDLTGHGNHFWLMIYLED